MRIRGSRSLTAAPTAQVDQSRGVVFLHNDLQHWVNSISSAILCSILVGSLKNTGNDIFVRSVIEWYSWPGSRENNNPDDVPFPIELFKMDHRLVGGRLSASRSNFCLTVAYPEYCAFPSSRNFSSWTCSAGDTTIGRVPASIASKKTSISSSSSSVSTSSASKELRRSVGVLKPPAREERRIALEGVGEGLKAVAVVVKTSSLAVDISEAVENVLAAWAAAVIGGSVVGSDGIVSSLN